MGSSVENLPTIKSTESGGCGEMFTIHQSLGRREDHNKRMGRIRFAKIEILEHQELKFRIESKPNYGHFPKIGYVSVNLKRLQTVPPSKEK